MKRMLSLMIAVLLLLSLCACKDSQKDQTAKPAFAYIHRYSEDVYTTALAEGFQKAAGQLGYDCRIVRPEADTAQAQAALVEELIKQGVRGIALDANQGEGLEDVLKKAEEAGIPVVTLPGDTKGSDLLVQPSSADLVGISLMDAMLDLTGGEGAFVVLPGETLYSGSNPWVAGMKAAAKDSKYAKLTWAQTCPGFDINGGVEAMKALISGLLEKYPDMEAICCCSAQTLALCCQAVEALKVNLRVTGLANPALMEELTGADRACPYYFFWNPDAVGACAANALEALVSGASLEEGGILKTKLGEYTLFSGMHADFFIAAGAPHCYGKE